MGEVKTLQHTLWFSADEHKYLVKYDVGGTATMELAKVWQKDKDRPLTFENKEPHFSVTMPTDWRFYSYASAGPQFSLQLIPPEVKAWAVLVWQKRGTDPDSASATTIAKADGGKLKGFFENYIADQTSWKEFEISGLKAAQYVAHYQKKAAACEHTLNLKRWSNTAHTLSISLMFTGSFFGSRKTSLKTIRLSLILL